MTTTVAAAMMATPMMATTTTTTMATAMMMIVFCHGGHAGTPPFNKKNARPLKNNSVPRPPGAGQQDPDGSTRRR